MVCLVYAIFRLGHGSSIIFLAGDICRRDIRERQIVLVSMNMLAQQSTAWIAVLVWKTVEAPRFLKGYTLLPVVLLPCRFGLWWYYGFINVKKEKMLELMVLFFTILQKKI